MNAIVWHGGGDLRYEAVDDPAPDAGHVVVDVRLAGVCGSDLHPLRGHHGPRVPPLILGHELVGTVPGREGRYVVFPLVSCGRCPACARGEEYLCHHRGLLGLDRPGAFAERVAVGEDALIRVPDGVSDRLAVLAEPLATAIAALRLERLPRDSDLAIIGCGPIGLLAVHVAKVAGHRVTAVEPLASRRDLASAFGADTTLADAALLLDGAFDAAIDAVGMEITLSSALRAIRPGGSVGLVGLGDAHADVDLADVVRRGLRLRGHYAYARDDFETALALLEREPIGDEWLTFVDLPDTAGGIRRLLDAPDETTKVVLEVGS